MFCLGWKFILSHRVCDRLLKTGFQDMPDGESLTLSTDMVSVVKAMAAPDSGLDIRDRMWLKITIPNAFIGEIYRDYFCAYDELYESNSEATSN